MVRVGQNIRLSRLAPLEIEILDGDVRTNRCIVAGQILRQSSNIWQLQHLFRRHDPRAIVELAPGVEDWTVVQDGAVHVQEAEARGPRSLRAVVTEKPAGQVVPHGARRLFRPHAIDGVLHGVQVYRHVLANVEDSFLGLTAALFGSGLYLLVTERGEGMPRGARLAEQVEVWHRPLQLGSDPAFSLAKLWVELLDHPPPHLSFHGHNLVHGGLSVRSCRSESIAQHPGGCANGHDSRCVKAIVDHAQELRGQLV
ncbi:hypothetical protein BKA81DRAFT_346887 [Phyllosticta paracitricarpa]